MKGPRTSSRHASREVALQTLFALDLAERGRADALERIEAKHASGDPRAGPAGKDPGCLGVVPLPAACSPSEAFSSVSAHFEMPTGAREFAEELVLRVSENRPKLDATLADHARNWRVERMAAVDRNVLRLAVYELSHTETPVAVVMNEAVELARRFGSDTSPSFVNGVLAGVAEQLRRESA